MNYCNHQDVGATKCFDSCSHIQFHCCERAAAFMANEPEADCRCLRPTVTGSVLLETNMFVASSWV